MKKCCKETKIKTLKVVIKWLRMESDIYEGKSKTSIALKREINGCADYFEIYLKEINRLNKRYVEKKECD